MSLSRTTHSCATLSLVALAFVDVLAVDAIIGQTAPQTSAQRTAEAPKAGKVAGEPIRLLVRPRVGDTLWMQLDQVMETRSLPVESAGDRTPGAGGMPGSPRTTTPKRTPEYGPQRQTSLSRTIAMRMYAHSLVSASDLQTTTLVATTDSMSVRVGSGKELGAARRMPLPAEGRHVRVYVSPNGAMSVVDPSPGAMALDATLSGMPPMLPSNAVSVGEVWERDIPLPSLPVSGVRADGVVHARFRLDSLSHGGRLAHVSMQGTLRRDGATRDLPPGTQLVTSGTMQATLVLDRTRAWITEGETTIQVKSDVIPAVGDPGAAVSLDIKLTQRLKVK